jgi:hypothetical protein
METSKKFLESMLKAYPNHRKNHEVIFRKIRPKLESALEGGISVKMIWEHMKDTGLIEMRYETFLRHIHKNEINIKNRRNHIKNTKT